MTERWQTIPPSPQYAPSPPPRGPATAVVLLLAFLVALIGAGAIHLVLEQVRPSAGGAAPDGAPRAARVVVPDVVGLTVQGARSRAELDHFLLHVVGPAPAGTLDAARVVSQHPLPGSLVRVDDVVVVRLVDDLPGVPSAAPTAASSAAGVASAAVAPPAAAAPIPDLTRLDVAAASDLIRSSGYTVGAVRDEISALPPGTVIAQRPAPGATAAPDSAVDLTVAASPPTVTVPSLGRIHGDEARSRLEAAGFQVRSDAVFSPSVPSGHVIQTKPAAGAAVAAGATILVYVAE